MDDVKQLLSSAKKLIDEIKGGIKTTLADPVIISWLASGRLDTLTDVCRILGVTKDIVAPSKELKPLAANIHTRLAALENDVGGLIAELSIKVANPDKLLRDAQAALDKCQQLSQQQMQIFLNHRATLQNADQTIRKNLTLEAMLKVASLSCPSKTAFALGSKVVAIAVEDKALPSPGAKLNELEMLAGNLGRRLQQLDLPEDLPQLASAALGHIIQSVKAIIERVGDYATDKSKQMSDLSRNILLVQEKCNSLKTLPVKDMLNGIKQEAVVLAEVVCAAEKYATVINSSSLAAKILDEARAINVAFQGGLIPEFSAAIHNPASPLAATTFAASQAHSFFQGSAGWTRMVRFIFRAIFGHRMVTETSLAVLTTMMIEKASLTADTNPANDDTFQNLLEEALEPYSQPFPYNDLARFLIHSLQTYAVLLENHLGTMLVDCTPEPGTLEKTNLLESSLQPLGKLIAKMEIRSENLQD